MKIGKKNNTNQQFDSEKMLLTSNPSFMVQEALKTLRTNVIFSLPGTGCKCIGVTSANRGEGKSTIAINLAISLTGVSSLRVTTSVFITSFASTPLSSFS